MDMKEQKLFLGDIAAVLNARLKPIEHRLDQIEQNLQKRAELEGQVLRNLADGANAGK